LELPQWPEIKIAVATSAGYAGYNQMFCRHFLLIVFASCQNLSVQEASMSRSEALEKAIQEIVKEEIEKFKHEQST
jgi:hypothetical protein